MFYPVGVGDVVDMGNAGDMGQAGQSAAQGYVNAGEVRSTRYDVTAHRSLTIGELEALLGRAGIARAEATRPTGPIRYARRRDGELTVAVSHIRRFFKRFAPRFEWDAALSEFVRWQAVGHNLVVTAGLNDSLDKHFKASSYTAAWYVGLTDGTPTVVAGDTMASHAGWVEITAYDEANRPALTLGSVSGGSVDNSASKATYTISANNTTIGGAFVATNSTKGGTTGTLYGAGAWQTGNDKVIDDNDTLSVTITLTATAA